MEPNAPPKIRKSGPRAVFRILILLTVLLALGWWLRPMFFPPPWGRANLRALDPADTPDPTADLTAVYTRRAGLNCQIRLDLLDLPLEPAYHLQISLGARQVTLSSLTPPPADATVTVDHDADTITVTLTHCFPRPNTPLTVLSFPFSGAAPDQVGPLDFDAPPPQGHATIQFAFYNTFTPAATPLQALRRWDGAHTGPNGERHGLRNLLNAAETYQTPVTLLDLKTPATLSAIDYLGGLAQIRRMEQSGLLQMPSVIFGQPVDEALALSRAAADKFGLRPGLSPFDTYAPQTLIPFNEQVKPTDGGLPLDFRRALLQATLTGGKTFTLGGDFQPSSWGVPDYVIPAFAYLAARPYIEVTRYAGPLGADGTLLENPGVAETSFTLPTNPIRRSALEMQMALSAPTNNEAIAALRQNYAHLVEDLLAAANWSENPSTKAECREVCTLASDRFYALLDPEGGRLVFFFAGEQQIIGPTAEFFIGFSDKMEWDLSKGEGADPAQVMGAFMDADMPFRLYSPVALDEKSIRFTAAEGRVKTYRLTETGLEVELSGPLETKIPLAVNPAGRFEPDWAGKYAWEEAGGRSSWGVKSGPMVWIQMGKSAVLARDSFLEGLSLGALPENPNAEIPAGMLLPFPMALVRISSQSGVLLRLEVVR